MATQGLTFNHTQNTGVSMGSIPNTNNPSNTAITGGNQSSTIGTVAPLIPGTSNTANVGITGTQLGSGLMSQLQATGGVSTNGTVPAFNNAVGTVAMSPSNSVNTVPSTAAASPTTSPVDNTLAGQTSQQQQELDKQLVDIYGKGEGNLLDSLIGNLGSNDSAYLQSYENAMAPANAENLSTLNTTLGNQGVSANSSAAAIADADFEKGVSSQDSAVEQQLVNQDTQDEIGLVQGLQNQSAAEVSYNGFYNFLGQMTSDAGALLGGSGNNSGGNSGAGNVNDNIQALNTISGADPLNLNTPGLTDTSTAFGTGVGSAPALFL